MANKLMLTFLGCEILFLLSGGLLIGFALFSESSMRSRPTPDTVAPHLLLKRSPLTATIVNAIFIFATFLLALPAIFLPTNRGWLRMHGYMVTFCATFTLVLGLITWIGTLQTRNMLGVIWAAEAPETQSLLQQKVCSQLSEHIMAERSRIGERGPSGVRWDLAPVIGLLVGQTIRHLTAHDAGKAQRSHRSMAAFRFPMRLTQRGPHPFSSAVTQPQPPTFTFP